MKNIAEYITESKNISPISIKHIINLALHFGHVVPNSTLDVPFKLLTLCASYLIVDSSKAYIVAFCDEISEIESCFKEIIKKSSKEKLKDYNIYDLTESHFMSDNEENEIKNNI